MILSGLTILVSLTLIKWGLSYVAASYLLNLLEAGIELILIYSICFISVNIQFSEIGTTIVVKVFLSSIQQKSS